MQLLPAGLGKLFPGLRHLQKLSAMVWKSNASHLAAFGRVPKILVQFFHGFLEVAGAVCSVLHAGHLWVRVSRPSPNVSAMVSDIGVPHFGQGGPSCCGMCGLIGCCMTVPDHRRERCSVSQSPMPGAEPCRRWFECRGPGTKVECQMIRPEQGTGLF